MFLRISSLFYLVDVVARMAVDTAEEYEEVVDIELLCKFPSLCFRTGKNAPDLCDVSVVPSVVVDHGRSV